MDHSTAADTSLPLHPAAAAEEDWPPPRQAYLTLALLSAGAIISQLDRQIINLVVEPLKAEFALSDAQFGALQGIAFGLFYTFMAVPLGILADRYQRRMVIGIGIAVFSVFSFLTGMSRTFATLILARMGVGVGEASLTPAGFSMIADSFPKHRLGRAISLFTMSNFVGTSIAFAAGGALISALNRVAASSPERLLGFEPWQLTFVIASLPGFLLAPCFFLLREPVRRGLAQGLARRMSLRALTAELGSRMDFLVPLTLGIAMVTTVSYALMTWTPALFIRVYGWEPARIGMWLGAIILVGSTTGSYFAGWLTDLLGRRGIADAPLKVAAWSFAGCGISGGLAPLMGTPEVALALIFLAAFFKCQPLACAPIALQLIVPNELRSQVSAVYLTVISLLGLIGGPVVVGLLSDHLFQGETGVRYSLSLVIAVSAPVMAALIYLSCRPYRRLAAATD